MGDRGNRRWCAASQAALMGNAESQPSTIEKGQFDKYDCAVCNEYL